MFCFIAKLKSSKEKINIWNKYHFNKKIKEKMENAKKLKNLNEEIIRVGMDNVKYIKEK